MNIKKCNIEGLYIIEPSIFELKEDTIIESYNQKKMNENNLNMNFVQDNQSGSKQGVLRGLHYQKKFPQGKLVHVIKGKIFDVAVDVRKDSNTYGQWFGVELSDENKKRFYISEGFAHGFYVMSDFADVVFKVSNYWNPEDEVGIPWNDPTIGINWPLIDGVKTIIAKKDNNYKPFKMIGD